MVNLQEHCPSCDRSSGSTAEPPLAGWFRAQFAMHEGAVRSYLRRRFGSLRDEDDLVQECFLRLWRSGRNAVNSRAFLITVARNLAYDGFRRYRTAERYVVSMPELPERPDPLPSPPLQLMRAEERAALHYAIAQLHPRCRETVVLRCIRGLSQREIALRLGITISAVEHHLVNGRRKCAALLRATPPHENASRAVPGASVRCHSQSVIRHADA